MKKVFLTILVTLAILISGFLIYISNGCYDVSQLTPHYDLTKNLIKKTKRSAIKNRMTENVVPGNINDTSVLISGFKLYDKMCTSCHGAPGVKAHEMVEGLYPKPPLMYKHEGQEDAQEFFWVIKNGIKLTSMPAYKPIYSNENLWAITAFVTEKLNKMSDEEYNEWVKKYRLEL